MTKNAKKKGTKRKPRRKAATVPREWPAAKAEARATSRLIPYARNARKHTKAQIAKIAASIREWGWTNPVLVDEKNGIIAGHGRVLAAEALGIQTIPVVVARGWSDAQCRAYVIADNQLSLDASWDLETLKLELEELTSLDFDIGLTGFDPVEIRSIVGNDELARADAAIVPAKRRKAVSVLGDRWELGDHFLCCDDARDAATWTGVEASMVWTDPPYGINYQGDLTLQKAKVSRRRLDGLEVLGDTLEGLPELLEQVFALAVLHTRPGSAWYVTGPQGGEAHVVFIKALDAASILRQTLIWVKDTLVLGRSDFHYRHEPLFYGWTPGGSHRFYGDRKNDTVWEIPRPKRSKEHPTMKPLALIARSLEFSSKEGDLVADPFAGSGSTIMACEALLRRCFSIELDPLYADVAIRRWQEHTSCDAILEGDGRSFNSIEKARSKRTRGRSPHVPT